MNLLKEQFDPIDEMNEPEDLLLYAWSDDVKSFRRTIMAAQDTVEALMDYVASSAFELRLQARYDADDKDGLRKDCERLEQAVVQAAAALIAMRLIGIDPDEQ